MIRKLLTLDDALLVHQLHYTVSENIISTKEYLKQNIDLSKINVDRAYFILQKSFNDELSCKSKLINTNQQVLSKFSWVYPHYLSDSYELKVDDLTIYYFNNFIYVTQEMKFIYRIRHTQLSKRISSDQFLNKEIRISWNNGMVRNKCEADYGFQR